MIAYRHKIFIFVFAFIFTFCINYLPGQTIFEDIPDSLLRSSHLIVLNEQYDFTIINDIKTRKDYKKDYLVLKKSDFTLDYLYIIFDKYTKIKKAKVEIYNKNNKRIKKINLSKFKKRLFVDNGTVSGDAGMRYVEIPDITPPYKIIFSYTVFKKGNTAFFPVWQPVNKEYESVISSRLRVFDNTKNNLRYKSINISSPQISKEKNTTIYEWEIKNFKYIKFEPFNDRTEDYFPMVLLAPNNFILEDYKSEMTNWESIGRFINKLNAKRNNFTEEQKKEIRNLISNDDDIYDKVKKIYNFLQQNTRYVSIQLGIGGWQPFESRYVHEKKYGDCKALTFYTKSMLAILGIKSYYTLVEAGKNTRDIAVDFPSLRFNHAILCVPISQDTVWLECTSGIAPFGYSGSFTDDRNVLVVDNSGGKLVKTHSYNSRENIKTVNIDIFPEFTTGNAAIHINTFLTGLAIEDNDFFSLAYQNKKNQRKWLLNILNLDNYNIKNFNIIPVSGDIIPKGHYDVDLYVKKIFLKAGTDYLFKPYVFNQTGFEPLVESKRISDIIIKRSFILEDTISITVPDNISLKKNVNYELNSEFGTYKISSFQHDNSIIFIRKVELIKGVYPPSKYEKFKTFINTILKKDNHKFFFTSG